MSGVAGGNRITNNDVESTFSSYYSTILKNIPGFKKAGLTGSVKARSKQDYGDLDIVVQFEGDDKKEVKQRIIDYITGQPDSVIVPFKSEKYAGKKYYNAGEIISVLYPIQNFKDEFIQIDNIISLTPEEHTYKGSFLDLPAEKQGLLLGLAKVILLEEDPKKVFTRLGITDVPALGEGQEYEFNLSSAKLTLRIVDLVDFKETGRKEVWSTTDWSKVDQLFQNFKTDGTFEQLLSSIDKRVKNPRSKRRIAGTFKSMVTVKSGEVGTPKGDAKTSAISKVDQILTEAGNAEVVALYAGGFKPPHRGHFNNAMALAKQADRLIVFIGRKIREGEVITPEQAKMIWQIYSRYLPVPTDIIIGDVTPVRSLYDWVDNHQDEVGKIVVGYGPGEESRYNYFVKNAEKYPKINLKVFNITTDDTDEKLSATSIRTDQKYLDSLKWVPAELNSKDSKQVYKAVKNSFDEFMLEQNMKKGLDGVLDEMFAPAPKKQKKIKEARTGLPVEPLTATPSKVRSKLVNLYNQLKNIIYEPDYKIDFLQNQIVISPKNLPGPDFDYNPFMASLLEYMISEGLKITPLPEVKIRKDIVESVDFFGKTAYYDPAKKEIILYVMNRHPKDVMRSFSHEMIHHMQNLEGRLQNISTQNVNEDDYLMKIEEEAYLAGNRIFRSWEDAVKSNG